MASKNKAEENAAPMEPAVKKAKTEEEAEKKDAEMKTEEVEEKEKETDASKDTRAVLKDTTIGFETAETTLNVVTTTGGRVLMALSDGGMQFLIAGARASVGMKAGRYFFEIKVIEALTPIEGPSEKRNKVPQPKQLVRVGFSTAGSSLILGDSEGGVCFDSAGTFTADKQRKPASQQFGRDQIIGVMLNLDSKSPNANTVSLFRNGERISQPQALPEHLKGKMLFPHVAFRNVSLQVHFGPVPLCPLPFKCRMLQEAANADVKEEKIPAPKGGKYDVLFPVAFPDEGTFDWLDGFLQKNPQYVELSDRMIQDWCVKSGIWKPRTQSLQHSNDKPWFGFGIVGVDDHSIRRAIMSVAPLMPRHYVVMEVKQNLIAAERKESLKQFALPHFNKVAHVVMGEPVAEYKQKIQAKLLEEKQAKAENEWKLKKIEKERKKVIAERQKQLLEAQKKIAEEHRKKKAEEEAAKKKEEEGKDGEAKDEEVEKEEVKTEVKEEVKTEDVKKEDEEKKEDEDMEDAEPPKAELSEEEKKIYFKPVTAVTDINSSLLSASFTEFSIPDKNEGFDEVNFEWDGSEKSNEYLRNWMLGKKITTRIEELQPSEWFTTTVTDYKKQIEEYQKKLKEYQQAKKDSTEEKAKTTAEGEENAEEEETKKEKLDVDITEVKDVTDVGSGEPLFKSFGFEDWALLAIRCELYALMVAFKKDVNDPDRIGIHESHLLFYYSRYFRKQLNVKAYGKDTVSELCDLVKDTVGVDPKNGVLMCKKPEDPIVEISEFVKMQEENRRERQRRIDAGDETVRLKFQILQQLQQQADFVSAPHIPRTVPAPRAVAPPQSSNQSWQNNQGWQQRSENQSWQSSNQSSTQSWQNNQGWQSGGDGDEYGKGGGKWQNQSYGQKGGKSAKGKW